MNISHQSINFNFDALPLLPRGHVDSHVTPAIRHVKKLMPRVGMHGKPFARHKPRI